MGNPSYKSKQEHLSECVSFRFANAKQELKIQTTAGILREAVKEKGGHNKPRVPFKRKEDGSRDKKVPYGKARWGTLGPSEVSTAIQKYCVDRIMSKNERKTWARQYDDTFKTFTVGKIVHQLPHQVGRQLQKSNAYKAKINSKVWKKGRAQ